VIAALRRWWAWAPGLEAPGDWRAWCASPVPLGTAGQPDVGFLPPLLRRRCAPLARAMLAATWGCCRADELPRVATVFASRHGNINESIGLLECVALGQPLSPTRFSHTVHNAQAGLFSIAADNREASSSIAACESTFGSGWLEALTLLERAPDRPVLLVVGDAPLDPTFALRVEEPAAFYAVALLLCSAADGHGLRFGMESAPAPGEVRPWPDALAFLRWYLSDEPGLVLASGRRRWRWERCGSLARAG
jgi:hypothetical protein